LSQELIETLKLPADQAGVLISGVVQDAPAAQGGVKPGDVLQSVAGEPVATPEQLLRRVAALKPDSNATLVLQRGGRTLDLVVKVGRRPPPAAR
jgi:serine protease DegQ